MSNKSKVKLSFIVPVYNAEKFLADCVNSLIEQTYKEDYEIILVDDGSKDSSPLLCDEFASESFIKVIHKQNGGVSSARLAGVKEASGDYIICVDADDTISNTLVEEIIKIIDKTKTDIVCYNYNNVDEDGNLINVQDNIFNGYFDKMGLESIYPKLIKSANGDQFLPSVWSKAIKKELILQCMMEMDNRIKIGEDMCLCVDCLFKAQNMYFINKPLYNYRLNSLSVTKRKKAFPWLDIDYKIDFLTQILPLNKFDFYEQICRMVVHSLFNVACSVIQEQEDYKKAKKIIKENLTKEKYMQYIKDCKFTNLKEKIAHYSIKHRNVWLMKMYCKLIKN